MFYELYSGKVPYFGLDPADIKNKILENSSLPMSMNIKSSVLDKINKCRSANTK